MSCSNCNSQTQQPCAIPTVEICQPLPYPITEIDGDIVKLDLSGCLAGLCQGESNAQEAVDKIIEQLCKLSPDAITSDCKIGVTVNGEIQWKTILEVIGECTPANPGDVITFDGNGVAYPAPPIDCSKLRSLLSSCIPSFASQATSLLGVGNGGIGYYQPPRQTCPEFMTNLQTCPTIESTPAGLVLSLESGQTAYRPLPDSTLDCNQFRDAFSSCLNLSNTPTQTAFTLQGGQPVLAPLDVQMDCQEFQGLLQSCPAQSNNLTTTALTLENGTPVYAPIAPFDPPANQIECAQPSYLIGSETETGDMQRYQRYIPYYGQMVFRGNVSQDFVAQSPGVLVNLEYTAIESERGLCGQPSFFNLATGVATVRKSATYIISLVRYVRARFNSPVDDAYATATVLMNVARNAGSVEGSVYPALVEQFRINEWRVPANNYLVNQTYMGSITLDLPAGSAIFSRFVWLNTPTNDVTPETLISYPSGANSGVDGFFSIREI